MTSVKKCILIPLEKYNQLLCHSHQNDTEEQQQISDPPIMYASEQDQSGHGSQDQKSPKWLRGIPSLFKRNVQAILDHLQDHRDILSWNDRGEIIYKGSIILGSNLTDLLKDSQRHYKQLHPIGDVEFYRAWAELNIPEGFLGNDKRKLEVRKYKIQPNDQYGPPPPGIRQKYKRQSNDQYVPPPPGIRQKLAVKTTATIPPQKWMKL